MSGASIGAVVLLATLAACGGSGSTDASGGSVATPLVPLTQSEVELVIAQGVTQAVARGVACTIAVSDREGNVVGVFRMSGAVEAADAPDAISAAGTAAYFASNQNALTTRTAEFIIQNHFPPGLFDTAGGPLYGVQNSGVVAGGGAAGKLLTTDVNPIGKQFDASTTPATLLGPVGASITGLTVPGGGGGVPLFKGGAAAGGVGVTADAGADANDLERIAVAASAGFSAPSSVRATELLLDGIRLPFTIAAPVADGTTLPFATVLTLGALEAGFPTRDSPGTLTPRTVATIGGVTGELRLPQDPGDPTAAKVADSPLADPIKLTAADVTSMLAASAARSQRIRAAIRRPLGTSMQCFVAVVDRVGNVLGVFRTPDATMFSFDVAVQKARTAAALSDDAHGFTTRAAGFLAQGFFPPGIDGTPPGPLFGLQDALTLAGDTIGGRLPNGITLFPGGIPLYKQDVMVGAIGVSGDGVDQDDFTSSGGAELFPAPDAIRCDAESESDVVAGLQAALDRMAALALDASVLSQIATCKSRVALGLQGVRLPWTKFPREPYR
jgi:uncharacterized protein GlcG (DUF336 family)